MVIVVVVKYKKDKLIMGTQPLESLLDEENGELLDEENNVLLEE